MPASDDWMSIDQLPMPAVGIPQDVIEETPEYRRAVKAFSALPKNQQEFVRAMPAAHYVAAKALANLKARGSTLSERTVYRWLADPKVKAAIDLQREVVGAFAGIDPLSVMLRVARWADYCEELVPAVDNNGGQILINGEPVLKKRDVVNGLKALELLGKHTHALGPTADDAPTRRQLPAFIVGVQIQNNPNADTTVKVVTNEP
jgi:hypothetical protein